MKITIEDYLYKIDNILNQKSKKDLYLIYVMIVFMTIGVSYMTLFDVSKARFDAEHAKVEQLEQKVNIDKSFLNANPPAKIAQLDREIKMAKQQYTDYKNYNQYIKHQIEQISSLFYDEQTWGEYLDSISENAKKYNVKVLNFSNKLVQKQSTFGHVLDIHVKVEGPYKNTLKFVNSIEKSFLVVDLHDFSLQAKDNLYSDFNISVWGIK